MLWWYLRSNINIQDSRGRTALHYAAQTENSCMIAQFLLEHGANAQIKDDDGFTVLHFAVEKVHLNLVQMLSGEVTIDISGEYGWTPLHRAAQATNYAESSMISYRGIINVYIGRDLRDIVQILLQAGADVNKTDADGRTALHWIARNGREAVAKEIIQPLLEWNADISVKDKYGCTALDYAKSKGVVEILEAESCDLM